MKKFFLYVTLVQVVVFCVPALGSLSQGAEDKPKNTIDTSTKVFVVVDRSRADYEKDWAPLLTEQFKSCLKCQIHNITPYLESGDFDESQLHSTLKGLDTHDRALLFIVWNRKMDPRYQGLVDLLSQHIQNGQIVVGGTGKAIDDGHTLPLSRTVLGKVQDILIIGELGERERLMAASFFGPEMLTAVKPPKDLMGKGYAPVFFASKLAQNWEKKTTDDWLSHFKSIKAKSRRLWPRVDEFFGR